MELLQWFDTRLYLNSPLGGATLKLLQAHPFPINDITFPECMTRPTCKIISRHRKNTTTMHVTQGWQAAIDCVQSNIELGEDERRTEGA